MIDKIDSLQLYDDYIQSLGKITFTKDPVEVKLVAQQNVTLLYIFRTLLSIKDALENPFEGLKGKES